MRVAVLGLGRMGRPIADRLLAAGHELSVWNRSPAKAEPLVAAGARLLRSPAEAREAADVWITMVADDNAVREVLMAENGLLAAAARERNGCVVEMSTVSVRCSQEIATRAAEAAVGYLRAPVSGNPSVVVAGNLSIIASGERAWFDGVEELLRDIGPNVFHVGEGEEARVLKLALNTMIAGTTELLAEALVLCEAHGLPRGTVLEVMGASAVGSPFVKYKTAGLLARDYSTTFPVNLMLKDLELAHEAAGGVPLPVASLVRSLIEDCVARGYGEVDLTALLPRLQEDARLGSDLS